MVASFLGCNTRAGGHGVVRTGRRANAQHFLRDVRGGATSIMATVVTVMVVAAAALIVDHNWLVDQRDTMKNASDSAAVAATIEMTRPGVRNKSDSELAAHLEEVAKTYVKLNLSHLSGERLEKAEGSLDVEVTPKRDSNTVEVSVSADLGGTLFSRHLPIMGNYTGPKKIGAVAGVEGTSNPIEVVLAIDISNSMNRRLDGAKARADGSDSRMAIVKRAATALVDILGPDEDDRIAVGLVPWQNQVRLDPATRAEWSSRGWTEYPESRHFGATYACKPVGSCTTRHADQDLPDDPGEEWLGCLDEQRVDGGHADLPAETALLSLPSEAPFAQGIYAAYYGRAYECIEQPLPDNLLYQYCYSTDTAGGFQTYDDDPAQRYCPGDKMPTILSLSPDAAVIRSAIDNLQPVYASTYSALGILWGQRLLTPGWKSVWGGAVHPVDPAAEDMAGARKAIVLLTDGADNQCGVGDPSCTYNQAGLKREVACALAKAAGTEIFVVAAMRPNDVSGTMAASLRACSSQADNPDGTYVFINNADADALETAFADIAKQLQIFRRVY